MIVFIDPLPSNLQLYSPAYPISLMEIAGYIKSRRSDCDIRILSLPLDYGFPLTEAGKQKIYKLLLDHLSSFAPLGIGISCIASSLAPGVIDLCERIKKDCSSSFLFVGGYVPTVYHHELLDLTSAIDAVVLGEGEIPALQIVEHLCGHRDPRKGAIPGMAWRESGKVTLNAPSGRFDLKQKSVIDPSLLQGLNANSTLHYSVSRGCSFRCNFCMEELVRPKRIEVPHEIVKQDLQRFREFLHVEQLLINDPTFSSFALLPHLSRLGLKASFETRCDVLTSEQMLQIAAAKICSVIGLGFESASYGTLRRMNKVNSHRHYEYYVENTKRLFKTAVKLNIPLLMTILLGYPGDTEDDLRRTYEFLAELATEETEAGYVFHVNTCKAFYKTKTYYQAKTMEGVEFIDDGLLGNNSIIKPSKSVDAATVASYSRKITAISKIRGPLFDYLVTAHPFYRLPAAAYSDPLVPDSCYKDPARSILDVTSKSMEMLRRVLPLIHKKYLPWAISDHE